MPCGWFYYLLGESMTPVFDKQSILSGWFDGKNIFDLDMSWIAFVSGQNVFESASLSWLGPVHQDCFLDTDGKPVAWLKNGKPVGKLTPLKPLRPLRPLRPLKPLKPLRPLKPLKPLVKLVPLGGWSRLTYTVWIKGN